MSLRAVAFHEVSQIVVEQVSSRNPDEVVVSAGNLELIREEFRPEIDESFGADEGIDQRRALRGSLIIQKRLDLLRSRDAAGQVGGGKWIALIQIS